HCGKENLDEVFQLYAQHNIPFMIFSISTDCCFTPRSCSLFYRRLIKNGVQARYKCISSTKGHDSFLLEPELYQDDLTAYLS
ncbi:MAG: hypothetical protein II349_07435, partial [Akkermansia sp.]|nr:hypothetical protein [Akkermansia sp.]